MNTTTKAEIKFFLKNEVVLIVSFFLAFFSCFVNPPSKQYIDFIDFRTLVLLFCLMVVISGFTSLGIFNFVAEKLIDRIQGIRTLIITFISLCFFSSMIITNDVAIITFVPFSIIVVKMCGYEKKIAIIVILETLAANLGGMMTPLGNPRNLYIYSFYNLSFLDFVKVIIPFSAFSFLLLILFALFVGKGKIEKDETTTKKFSLNTFLLVVYTILFILSLLSVFKVLPFIFLLPITIITVLFADKKTLVRVDYSLLLTFVFLFIFIGNLGTVDSISKFLSGNVFGNEVFYSVLLSQVFSNMPTTVLLSNFTNDAKSLLVGVNLGGLGTLISSMSGLISFKIYSREKLNNKKYVVLFSLISILFLCLNLILWAVIKSL